MDRIDQFTALILAGDDKVAARVDYQACERCGFRLMRVETTIIGNQQLIATHCPICEQFDNDGLGPFDASLLGIRRLRYFDAWLTTHGLTQDTLENHYHLSPNHFFDDQVQG